MPMKEFNGETFVAFMDISGFKVMMRDGGEKAINALNLLYQTGYDTLQYDGDVSGLFISDSGVLYVHNKDLSVLDKLKCLLKVIKDINRMMIKYDIMLTTSIAYDNFSYHNRIELDNVVKNPIYGNAYVKAFLDSEDKKNKIEPGVCRIVYNEKLKEALGELEEISVLRGEETDNLFIKQINKGKHIKFYWNVDSKREIDYFEKQYNNAYNTKYAGFLNALKHR